MMKLAAGLLLATAAFVRCDPRQAGPMKVGVTAQPRLTGGFIAYWNNMMARPEAEWCQVLGQMKAVGMNTVIVQRLVYHQAGTDSWFTPAVNDPTAAILRCAAARQMQVYVGLWEDPDFKLDNINHTYLGEAARKSAEVVDSMRTRNYASFTSFAGCYAPLEPYNFHYDANNIAALWTFFDSVSRACKGLRSDPPVKVAIAAFFNPVDPKDPQGTSWLASPEETERVYREVLDKSGIDVLMVQDGAGTRTAPKERWKGRLPEYLEQIPRYFTAFRNAAVSVHPSPAFWSDVELFNGGSVLQPADWTRVRQQLVAGAPVVGNGEAIGYDFYHYMNPCLDSIVEQGAPLARGRESRRVALYREYAAYVSVSTGPCPAHP